MLMLKKFFRKVLTNIKLHDIIRTSNKLNGGLHTMEEVLKEILKRIDTDSKAESPYSKNPLDDIMNDDDDDDDIE